MKCISCLQTSSKPIQLGEIYWFLYPHETDKANKIVSKLNITETGLTNICLFLEHGDALWLLSLDFALEYTLARIQANQEGLKLNGTDHFLVYADYDSTFGGKEHNIQKKHRTLLVPRKEIGLEINADKTKYPRLEIRMQENHNIKNDNKSFEGVEEFKYLGTTLTNKNSIQEEIKNRLKSGNACRIFRFLSKNIKIKKCR